MSARSLRPMRGRDLLRVTAVALVLAGAVPAAAQDRRAGARPPPVDPDRPQWLILPSSAGAVPAGWSELPRTLAVRLRAEGVAVHDPDEARRLFERRASAEAAPVERTELEQLGQRIERAMVLVATGQRRGALREMGDSMDLLRRASETINREANVARTAFDGCLITVRALLELRQRDPARDRARECQRLFPDVEVDPQQHPPWVIGFLAEVRAELDMEPRGTLRVTAERTGCGVYLQGLRVGTTPFERGDFTPGEQRIQVTCTPDRPGRVHRLILGAQPTTLEVDTRFDEAVRTTGVLELRYPTAPEEDRRRLADALVVAGVLGATEVLLATPTNGLVRLDRVRVRDAAVLASVLLRLGDSGPDGAEVRLAAAALGRGESADVSRAMTQPWTRWRPPSTDAPVEVAPAARRSQSAAAEPPLRRHVPPAARPPLAAEPSPDRLDPSNVGRLLGGSTLAVTGLGLLGTGWYLYATTNETQGDWDIGIGSIGAALAGLGVGVLKPREQGTPVASLTLGGIGLAFAGAAIYAFAVDGDCSRSNAAGQCIARTDSSDLGVMLLDSAAPFFAFPLTQLVQKLTTPEEEMTVTASVSSRHMMLLLQGAL